jgi:hypothetical protein
MLPDSKDEMLEAARDAPPFNVYIHLAPSPDAIGEMEINKAFFGTQLGCTRLTISQFPKQIPLR